MPNPLKFGRRIPLSEIVLAPMNEKRVEEILFMAVEKAGYNPNIDSIQLIGSEIVITKLIECEPVTVCIYPGSEEEGKFNLDIRYSDSKHDVTILNSSN